MPAPKIRSNGNSKLKNASTKSDCYTSRHVPNHLKTKKQKKKKRQNKNEIAKLISYIKTHRCFCAPKVIKVILVLDKTERTLKDKNDNLRLHTLFLINFARCANFKVLRVSSEQLQETKNFVTYHYAFTLKARSQWNMLKQIAEEVIIQCQELEIEVKLQFIF